MVEALRRNPRFIPGLSLVAVHEGAVGVVAYPREYRLTL